MPPKDHRLVKQLGSPLVRDGFPNYARQHQPRRRTWERLSASKHSAIYQFPVPRRAVTANVLRLTTPRPFPSTDSNWPKQVYERGGVANLGVKLEGTTHASAPPAVC